MHVCSSRNIPLKAKDIILPATSNSMSREAVNPIKTAIEKSLLRHIPILIWEINIWKGTEKGGWQMLLKFTHATPNTAYEIYHKYRNAQPGHMKNSPSSYWRWVTAAVAKTALPTLRCNTTKGWSWEAKKFNASISTGLLTPSYI